MSKLEFCCPHYPQKLFPSPHSTLLRILNADQENAVGKTTNNGLNGQGIECRWGFYTMGNGSFSQGESDRNVELNTHPI
jgi:hypothetical protein